MKDDAKILQYVEKIAGKTADKCVPIFGILSVHTAMCGPTVVPPLGSHLTETFHKPGADQNYTCQRLALPVLPVLPGHDNN